MTHRRKSVAVEARQVTAEARESVIEWIRDEGVMALEEGGDAFVIVAPPRTSRVVSGSWVIHDPVQGFEVCEADAFDGRFYETGGAS